MSPFVPALPFRTWTSCPGRLAFLLGLAHLVDQLVVEGPVVLRTKELGNDDYIVVLQRLVVPGLRAGADAHAERGSDERGLGVEGLRVAARGDAEAESGSLRFPEGALLARIISQMR